MKWWNVAVLAAGAFALAMFPLGCGDDDDNGGGGGGGGTLEGEYELYAGFVSEGGVDGAAAEGMIFVAYVERLNTADPSAKTAVVKVNGTTIPLITTESTDAEATFRSDAIEYSPETSYAVTIEIGGETASSTILAPDYTTAVAITAPVEGAEFAPGQALAVSWSYTGTTPAKALLVVTGSTATEDEDLYEQLLAGTATSASIPGSETNTWDDFEDVMVAVGAGVTQSWSGEMAHAGSYSYVLLSTDFVTIHPEGGAAPTWSLTVTAADASIGTGETTTITVEIEDGEGNPPALGTVVNLSVSPSGIATINPATVQTNAQGTATATLTAGSTAGTATVSAVAPSLDDADDQVTVSITGGGGEPGTYNVSAGFLTAAEEDPAFIAVVERLDDEDPSAKDAVVTVNGSEVPLSQLASSDSLAIFESTSIPYAASTPYTITVTLGGKTATSSFTSPSYLCTIDLTAPATMSEFTAGVDIEAEWTLTGDNPPQIMLGAGGAEEEGDPDYVYVELAGTARSYTIDTSGWTGFEMAAVIVTVGESYEFTGNLASELSGTYVNLTTDMALLLAAGSGEQWVVSVDTYQSVLAPNGTDTTMVWATVEDYLGQPCPDGETVTFSISGPGTLSAETAQTVDGRAWTILTAGTEEGIVTIGAEAYGQTDETNVMVTGGGGEQYLLLITFPLLDPGMPTLAPGATTTLHVSLATIPGGNPCADGTEITLTSMTIDQQTDYLTFGDTTLLTSGGEAETSVTAGSTVPFMGIVTVTATTTAVEYSGGVAALQIEE